MNFLMMPSRACSAVWVGAGRGEAKAAQHPKARRGEAEKSGRDNRHDRKRDELSHDAPVNAQQLPVLHAVAKPRLFSTRWPDEVKPRNPAATIATTASAMIFFMMPSRARSAAWVDARRGEAEAAQHPMARRGETKKSSCDNCHDRKRDDLFHDVLS
jgi:hypothetical protein